MHGEVFEGRFDNIIISNGKIPNRARLIDKIQLNIITEAFHVEFGRFDPCRLNILIKASLHIFEQPSERRLMWLRFSSRKSRYFSTTFDLIHVYVVQTFFSFFKTRLFLSDHDSKKRRPK